MCLNMKKIFYISLIFLPLIVYSKPNIYYLKNYNYSGPKKYRSGITATHIIVKSLINYDNPQIVHKNIVQSSFDTKHFKKLTIGYAIKNSSLLMTIQTEKPFSITLDTDNIHNNGILFIKKYFKKTLQQKLYLYFSQLSAESVKNYSEGMAVIQLLKIFPYKVFGFFIKAINKNETNIEAHIAMADCLFTLNDFNQSRKYYNKAKRYLSQFKLHNTYKYFYVLYQIADTYRHLGKYNDARAYYEMALEGLKKRYTLHTVLASKIFFKLGLYSQYISYNNLALKQYTKAAKILEVLKQKKSPLYISLLYHKGQICHSLMKRKKAINLYSKGLSILYTIKNRMRSHKLLEAKMYAAMGKTYDSKGNIFKAYRYYMLSRKMYRNIKFTKSTQYAILLYNLAHLLYKKMRNPCRAVTYLKECIKVEELIKHKDLVRDRTLLEKIKLQCK